MRLLINTTNDHAHYHRRHIRNEHQSKPNDTSCSHAGSTVGLLYNT